LIEEQDQSKWRAAAAFGDFLSEDFAKTHAKPAQTLAGLGLESSNFQHWKRLHVDILDMMLDVGDF
jgi:hypothetical protein